MKLQSLAQAPHLYHGHLMCQTRPCLRPFTVTGTGSQLQNNTARSCIQALVGRLARTQVLYRQRRTHAQQGQRLICQAVQEQAEPNAETNPHQQVTIVDTSRTHPCVTMSKIAAQIS